MTTINISGRHNLVGFPRNANHKFNINERTWRVGAGGVRTLNLLAELYHARSTTDLYWLVKHRELVREIKRLSARPVLTLVIQQTSNAHLRKLAVWLRGLCGGTLGTKIIFDLRDDGDESMRRVVTRALRRMSAWWELRRIARWESSPAIQRMATAKEPTLFGDRLSAATRNFTRGAPSEDRSERSRMTLSISRFLDLAGGKPPKSPQVIREILLRIHRLICGQST
jgi:hypothetical protein